MQTDVPDFSEFDDIRHTCHDPVPDFRLKLIIRQV